MNEREFITIARELVATTANKQLAKKKNHKTLTAEDVTVIFYSASLMDSKILASISATESIYEVVYNENKGEIHLSIYQQVQTASFRVRADEKSKEVLQ